MNILNNGRFGMAAALGGTMKYLVGRAMRYVIAQWASLLIKHEDMLGVLSVRHCDKCVVSGYVYVYIYSCGGSHILSLTLVFHSQHY